MELGEKLRAARLEARLSQRALCGDRITRNMLSQIENGTARPSVATLEYLAAGLGKPVSYFLEDAAAALPNLMVMQKAREHYAAGAWEEALTSLKEYRMGDDTFDPEYYLLLSLTCCEAAKQAAGAGRLPYAQALLRQSLDAAERTVFSGPKLQAFALQAWLAREEEEKFLPAMERLTKELGEKTMLLLAQKILGECGGAAARGVLSQAPGDSWEKAMLVGDSYLKEGAYAPAAEAFLQAERDLERCNGNLRQVYERLEICFRELEDYKMAYFYAAKQK